MPCGRPYRPPMSSWPPYEGLDSPIVLSAWQAQVAVDSPEDERIEQFVAEYWQSPDAPEPGAACTGGLDAPGRIA